jgi:aldehyde:ferredoxin oxidoreductase
VESLVGGYVGKTLNINLSTGEVAIEDLDTEIIHQYIGGRGYGTKILNDKLKPQTDPLSPGNLLIFATGPLTGTNAPTSGRFSVSSKSPLTGTIFDSNCGGTFGPEMKKSGFDFIIIKGKSENPVYLYMNDGRVEIKSAKKIWGKTVDQTEDAIRADLKEANVKVASIGPAGENRVRIAAIMSDKHRAAGRGGLGAVMGSKKLKAIVVKGTRKIEVANSHAFQEEVKLVSDILRRNPVTGDSLTRYGTATLITTINKAGVFPTKNFQEGIFEEAEKISGEVISNKLLVRRKGCFACPIACGRVIKLTRGFKRGQISEGPEYETVWAFGAQCGISDIEEIALANDLCNSYGLDTISMGNIIGFAIESFEKGLLTERDTDKLKLRWGDPKLLTKLIELTANRKGFGNLLAEGVKRISEKIGATDLAMHVKGLELPAYDARGVKGMGLSYATSNRGGCHLRSYTIMSEVLSYPCYLDPLKVEGKASLVKNMQDIFAMLDSMIMCKFTAFALFETLNYEPKFYARLLTTATGFYYDEDEFRLTGERIYNLERLFNLKEGFNRSHDTLPLRFLQTPIPEGPAKGEILPLEKLLFEYYKIRGWDLNGAPTDAKLQELGILTATRWPKLQVALDLGDLDEALRIAEASYRGGAEWLEAGTPLIKNVGMQAVRELKRRFPAATIVADLKTLDAGWLETELAAQAGADIVCISGLAHDNTVKDAVGCARKYGVKIMVDLIEVKDPYERAIQLEKLGIDYICLHSGIDTQRDRRQEIDRKIAVISKIAKKVGIPVAVAGGIRADTAANVVKAGAKVVIVGGAITRAANPESATIMIKKSIEQAVT